MEKYPNYRIQRPLCNKFHSSIKAHLESPIFSYKRDQFPLKITYFIHAVLTVIFVCTMQVIYYFNCIEHDMLENFPV